MLHHIENHIENMRQKPDHVKKQYAFGVSLAFTVIILFVWVSTHTLSLDPEAAALAKKQAPLKTLTASAGDAFTGTFGYFKSLFGGNKVEYVDPIEVVPGKI
jgi:hypothetical protein